RAHRNLLFGNWINIGAVWPHNVVSLGGWCTRCSGGDEQFSRGGSGDGVSAAALGERVASRAADQPADGHCRCPSLSTVKSWRLPPVWSRKSWRHSRPAFEVLCGDSLFLTKQGVPSKEVARHRSQV